MQALFFRDYRKFHGGNLKVWDYFNHTRAAPGWEAWIQFAPRTRWDASNPWHAARDRVVDAGSGLVPDLFFVAGRDWVWLDRHPAAGRGIPVINLIQHVRHADESHPKFEFLGRPAIRICVSDVVATAIRETNIARGPLLTIPNALDLDQVDAFGRNHNLAHDRLDDDLLIVGLKQPVLARDLAEALTSSGVRARTVTELLPREEFLGLLGRARVTLFLPNETEGFYLPALEGMALGTVVVCPDCEGNRSFVLDGETGFRPPYERSALLAAVTKALALDNGAVRGLRVSARVMAERHGSDHERRAFHAVLADLDRLWRDAGG